MSRRILVLYWEPRDTETRLTVHQHMHALDAGNDEIIYHNTYEAPAGWLRLLKFDAVVLHTILLCTRWADMPYFLAHRERYAWVRDLNVPKIAIPQDEYDHSEVLDEWFSDWNVTDILTNFGPETRALLYPTMSDRARFHEVLTGYIDTVTAASIAPRLLPFRERQYDIVYRATKLPYWFGSHGQLKHEIADVVRAAAVRHDLETDISTRVEDTIFGPSWLDFLASGRVVIGAESGSSVLDRRGDVRERIRGLLAAEPDLSFEEVSARMPSGWDSYAFYAISPRHLEAVMTKTCQILVEGRYSGVLQPNRHFIPLRRDFANLDEVMESVQNHALLEEIAERAYEEVYLGGKYSTGVLASIIRSAAGTGRRRSPLSGVMFPALRRGGALAGDVSRAANARMEQGLALAVHCRDATRRVKRTTVPRLKGSAPIRPLVAGRAYSSEFLRVAPLAARPALSNRPLRQALIRYFAWPGPRAGPAAVARDLLRLSVVTELARGGGDPPGAWSVQAVERGGELVLRSARGGRQNGTGIRPNGDVCRIVWDHTAIGDDVPFVPGKPGRGSLVVGEHGVYEFVALTAVARRYPELLRSAIRSAVLSR